MQHADHGSSDGGDHGPNDQGDQRLMGNSDDHNMLHSEERELQDNGCLVLVEHKDPGPLSTEHSEIMYELVRSVDNEHMNNLHCEINTVSSQTQGHTPDGSRKTPLDISVTQPDSLSCVGLTQQSSGRTDSESISESSGIGEMSQTSDSEPTLVICGDESMNLEGAAGTAVYRHDGTAVEYCPKTCDSVEEDCRDGHITGVPTRGPCSAAPSGSLQHTDGHIDGHSPWKDVVEMQPIIQIVVSFTFIAVYVCEVVCAVVCRLYVRLYVRYVGCM